MTIVVDAHELEQVKKQLHKLVNVVKISELEDRQAIEREIMLVRVNAQPGPTPELLSLASIFDATAVDVGPNSIAFQVVGAPDKVNDFLDLVRPYGVVDLVKSGGSHSLARRRAGALRRSGRSTERKPWQPSTTTRTPTPT
jgi:acetolactate synthase I/III small subunit